MDLSEALDLIRDAETPVEAAAEAARELDEESLLAVAALDLSARIGTAVTDMTPEGTVRYGAIEVGLMRAPDGVIHYEDRNVAFSVSGLNAKGPTGPSRLESMLRLIAYARDHSDSLAFLPSDLREERLAELAGAYGAQADFVRGMSATYRSSARELNL